VKKLICIAASIVIALGTLAVGFHWFVNRAQVPEGQSLILRYKGPLLFGSSEMSTPGYWAKEGQVGTLEKLRGPGRHFYCPLWWERDLVADVLIEPGKVGIVTCKMGDALPEGEFLVDGEVGETKFKGVLRKVLGPGRYRINPYGYDVKVVGAETTDAGRTKKQSGWVVIPTGYVGVVTNLADNPHTKQKSGIQDKVLQPGIYPTNPREQQVDVVEIGYRETSVTIKEAKRTDDSGEPDAAKLEGGISFPSSDGFRITMDFTAIWGLMPSQAPNAIRKFGNVDLVEQKVILPQIESICRNNGSEYNAVQLLVGKEREDFQVNTLGEFKTVLKSKDISLLYGLVRHIYIPKEVRQPIQTAFVADELKLTREQEQRTAKMEADLREAERKVELERSRTEADTRKLVGERLAEGTKLAAETRADTRKLVAAIAKETANYKAESRLVLGEATNKGKQLVEEAKAGRFKLAVDAFGTPTAYNNWTFATNLPDNIELRMLYAGPGTMWTDLQGAVRIMAAPISPKEKEHGDKK
jgi:regulator of protease activity HflC (stomatin/prohibitin superfamily)